MKRLYLTMSILLTCITTWAEGYDYFYFKQIDGTETSLAASNLTITFENGNAIATSGVETKTLALASLQEMYFSNGISSINNVTAPEVKITVCDNNIIITTQNNANVIISNSTGIVITQTNISSGENLVSEHLQKGIYIVNVNGQTYKTIVK